MTPQERAAEAFEHIKRKMIDGGYWDNTDDNPEVAAAVVGAIETAIIRAVADASRKTENRIGLTETAKLEVHKPVDGKIEITGYAIRKPEEGRCILLPGQEFVVHYHEGKCRFVVRG